METLRSDNGCPWDAEQTSTSLRPYILEEAYEVIEAIISNNKEKVRDELGDLLFQVVFQSQIYSEAGAFTFNDVAGAICNKLIRRHPHVFAQETFESTRELHRQWEAIKRQERKKQGSEVCLLSGMTENLPALMKSQKILTRLARASIENSNPLGSVQESVERFTTTASDMSPEQRHVALGGILLNLVDVARAYDCDAETALLDTCNKIAADILQAEKQQKAEADLPPGELSDYFGSDYS